MKFIKTGGPYGDQTSSYSVHLNDNFSMNDYTVNMFIEEVLKTKDWGYIGIYNLKERSVFGKPNIEYSHGKLKNENFEQSILDSKIKNIRASGGWSRMDYLLELY